MGFDVTIIASKWIWDKNGELCICERTDYINEDGVKVIRIKSMFGDANGRLKVYPSLIRTVADEMPDILFIHDCQFLDIIRLSRYLRQNTQITAFIDNHVDYSNGAHGWLSKRILHGCLWRYCVNKIEPYTKMFWGVLPARVEFLKERYRLPEEKCQLLVMGADDELVEKARLPEIRDRIRGKYHIEKQDFLIVTGGKIDVYKKQILDLMQAVEDLQKESEIGSIKLLVFGSIEKEIREEALSFVDGNVIQFIGWLNSIESYQIFASADLVIFPGRHSVYWEQVAAQGIPMIVKDWEGTHHVDLGGNVIILKEDSAELIRETIRGLLRNPDQYLRMKRIAEERGMSEFSYREIARRSISGI